MSLKRGLAFFLLLALAVCGAILFFSMDRASLEIFKGANPFRLYLAFMFVLFVWLLDALKMYLLTRAAGGRLSWKVSLELTWINYFGAALTPMQSGGGPFQMYIMYHNGISVGQSVAITIIRTVLIMLMLGAMIPFTALVEGDLPALGWGARGFIFYVVIFILAIWAALIVSIVKPVWVKRAAVRIITLLRRVGLLKKKWESKLLKFAVKEIDAYNANVRAFLTTGRKPFIAAAVVAFLQLLTQLSVMPCMIWALGFPVKYFQCVLVQAVFLFLLYFIPTPGGSGAAEGGAALVFSMFVPWNVAGMLGVGWRALTEYTGIILGSVVAVRRIGWKLANQLMTSDGAGEKTDG
ncbi:MAG: flippase-like domain-containing protein, partial [Synergistaceae bacterium]|nr:flippase-like domain-containing protein [Synergistaceae bacterium]